MVIKRSSAGEVAALLHDLETGDDAARDRAVARLSIIGTRAVDGLLRVMASARNVTVRAAALSALEAIGDPRAIEPAFGILDDGEASLSASAAAVLRAALDSPRGTEVLDRLTALALDTTRPEPARLAALAALQVLPARVLAPIWGKLEGDASAAVRAAVGRVGPAQEMDPLSALEAAASSGSLPDDPETVRRWLSASAAEVSLPVLHRLVELLRAREAQAAAEDAGIAWMRARAAVHLALAHRGSRVALYDLRETIESANSAPVEMLSALEAIGDRSCLEPIAAAYARLSAPPVVEGTQTPGASSWWCDHLAAAFRAIAAREKLTERHSLARQIRSRWPGVAADLLGPARR